MFMQKNNNYSKMISAKNIVRKYHISYQTVNHYTDFGLLQVLMKKGNVRFYDKDIVDKRLAQITALVEEGYSLRLIRKKLIGI
jgi:DNA-binding transcriptional MerR regulator